MGKRKPKPTKPAVKLSAADRQELLAAIETAELIATHLLSGNTTKARDEYRRLHSAVWTGGHPIKKLLAPIGETVLMMRIRPVDKDGLLTDDVGVLRDSGQRRPAYGDSELHHAVSGMLNTLGTWYAKENAPQGAPEEREQSCKPTAEAVKTYCQRLRTALDMGNEPLTDAQQRVLYIIAAEGPIQGTKICYKTGVSQSGLTRYIIPALKEKRGVKTAPGAGYYLPKE